MKKIVIRPTVTAKPKRQVRIGQEEVEEAAERLRRAREASEAAQRRRVLVPSQCSKTGRSFTSVAEETEEGEWLLVGTTPSEGEEGQPGETRTVPLRRGGKKFGPNYGCPHCGRVGVYAHCGRLVCTGAYWKDGKMFRMTLPCCGKEIRWPSGGGGGGKREGGGKGGGVFPEVEGDGTGGKGKGGKPR
jgi:hypothetical protein